jgi:hypothetical protein
LRTEDSTVDVVRKEDIAAPEVSVAVNAEAEHRIFDQMALVEAVVGLCAEADP